MALLDELTTAKETLAKGDVNGAWDLLAKVSQATFQKEDCPECGAPTDVLVKGGHVAAECKNCGSNWGKRSSGPIQPLVKSQSSKTMAYEIGKPEVTAALWDLWRRTGGQALDAFDINNYATTGVIKKSHLEAIGIKVPAESEMKKAEPIVKPPEETLGNLTKSQVLDVMFKMFQNGEQHRYVNRHSIAKCEQFGLSALDEDCRAVVLQKSGGAPKLEDQEGMDPELADPGLAAREEPKARFGRQQQPIETKRAQGIGDAKLKQLVFDNPHNGESEGLRSVGQGEATKKSDEEALKSFGFDPASLRKSSVVIGHEAPAPTHSLGHHFIFSAENPAHEPELKAGHEAVLHGLRRHGYDAREAKGKYGGKSERSIIVRNPNEHQAVTLHDLARKLGQESALHSDGTTHRLHYYHGENAGKYHEGKGTEWMTHEPEDAYTEISDPDSGSRSFFRHNLDFSQLHDHVKDQAAVAGVAHEAEAELPHHDPPKLEVVKSLAKSCPACGADKDDESAIGGLGNTSHYRCRDCGSMYSDETARGGREAKAEHLLYETPEPKPLHPSDRKKTRKAQEDRELSVHMKALHYPAHKKSESADPDAVAMSKAVKSLAPAPSAVKAPGTLMKKPMAKGVGKKVEGFLNDINEKHPKLAPGLLIGGALANAAASVGKVYLDHKAHQASSDAPRIEGPAVPGKAPLKKGIAGPKPGMATPPKPSVSAKAITTPVGPKLAKVGLPKLGAAPAHPGNVEIERKQSVEPEAQAHSLTAPKPSLPKFNPASIGLNSSGKRVLTAVKIKKSEALERVQKRLEQLGKSAVPSDRMMLRKWAELYTRITLEKSDEVWLEEL